jgi:hypothetical protein
VALAAARRGDGACDLRAEHLDCEVLYLLAGGLPDLLYFILVAEYFLGVLRQVLKIVASGRLLEYLKVDI